MWSGRSRRRAGRSRTGSRRRRGTGWSCCSRSPALTFIGRAQEGLRPGVLNVSTGDGVPVGDGLVRHPDIALVSLTGDVETGKTSARNAADTLKRVHLELGGKAPMVVLDDADPA